MQPCLIPEVTGIGIIVFLDRDFSMFITCTREVFVYTVESFFDQEDYCCTEIARLHI